MGENNNREAELINRQRETMKKRKLIQLYSCLVILCFTFAFGCSVKKTSTNVMQSSTNVKQAAICTDKTTQNKEKGEEEGDEAQVYTHSDESQEPSLKKELAEKDAISANLAKNEVNSLPSDFEEKEDLLEKEIISEMDQEDETKTEETKTEGIKTEETKTEEIKTEGIKTEEIKTEEIKTEEIKTEETKTDESKTEETKTNVEKNQEDKSSISGEKENSELVIVLDAGHQEQGNYEKEPIGPGATEKKAKVSSGTQGVVTRQKEYELNLIIADRIKEELVERGYTVVMCRETHKVNLSNSERAQMANEAGAAAFLRIHANGSENKKAQGIMTICQTKQNPYNAELYEKSKALSSYILDDMLLATGAKSKGVWETDTMSGINWCKVPVTIIEMGFLSNEEEDRRLATKDYQEKLIEGIVNGLERYLARQ